VNGNKITEMRDTSSNDDFTKFLQSLTPQEYASVESLLSEREKNIVKSSFTPEKES